MLNLAKFKFPLARELGSRQRLNVQTAQQRHELEGLGRRHHFTALAIEVFLGQEPFDDGGPGCGSAQAFAGHRIPQVIVFDKFASALHGRQERRLGIPGGWLGLQGQHINGLRLWSVTWGDSDEAIVFLGGFFAVDTQPARRHQNLALGFKPVFANDRPACGVEVLGSRKEHGQQTTTDQVVELLLGLGE